MNATFNISRLRMRLATELSDAFLRIGSFKSILPVLIDATLPTVILLCHYRNATDTPTHIIEDARALTFFLTLLFMTITYIAMCYGGITDKRRGSSYLMMPASNCEKTVTMVLISTIIIPFSIILCYLAVDALLCYLLGSWRTGMNLFFLSNNSVSMHVKCITLINGEIPAPAFCRINLLMIWIKTMLIAMVFLNSHIWFRKGKVIFGILILIIMGLTKTFINSGLNLVTYSDWQTQIPAYILHNYNLEDIMTSTRIAYAVIYVKDFAVYLLLSYCAYTRIRTIQH